jgi:hypothetical protein
MLCVVHSLAAHYETSTNAGLCITKRYFSDILSAPVVICVTFHVTFLFDLYFQIEICQFRVVLQCWNPNVSYLVKFCSCLYMLLINSL